MCIKIFIYLYGCIHIILWQTVLQNIRKINYFYKNANYYSFYLYIVRTGFSYSIERSVLTKQHTVGTEN